MTRPMDNLKARIAPGADLTADRSTWPWVDITEHLRNTVEVRHGRRSESADSGPDEATITVQNDDGKFAPDNPLGPWYPGLDEGTPLQIYWDTTDNIRFDGNITDLPIQWRVPSRMALSTIQASGPLERLQRGAKPLQSPMFRAVSRSSNVVAYWPFERDVSSPIPGVAPALIGDDVEFGVIDAPAGSNPLVRMPAGSPPWRGRVPSYPDTGSWRVDWLWRMDEVPPLFRTPMRVITNSATAARFWIQVGANLFSLRIFDTDDNVVFNDDVNIDQNFYGDWVAFSLRAAQDGTGMGFTLLAERPIVDGDPRLIHQIAGTLTNTQPGRVRQVRVFELAGTPSHRSMGHVTISSDSTPHPFRRSGLDVVNGMVGELAGDRFRRLCDEEGIARELIG